MRFIRLASEIGLVGGSIEDATGDPKDPIHGFQLAVERVAAAAKVAHECRFMLMARAENFLHGRPDLGDTIRRLQSFADAGADVVYAPGLPSLEAIREVCKSVSKPVNVVMGLKGATYSVEDLSAAGVRRISVGGAFARAALGAFVRAAREVKDKGTFTFTFRFNSARRGKRLHGRREAVVDILARVAQVTGADHHRKIARDQRSTSRHTRRTRLGKALREAKEGMGFSLPARIIKE